MKTIEASVVWHVGWLVSVDDGMREDFSIIGIKGEGCGSGGSWSQGLRMEKKRASVLLCASGMLT